MEKKNCNQRKYGRVYAAASELDGRGEGHRAGGNGCFFRARLDGYEEHMSLWSRAYKYMGTLVPEQVEKLLDLGCGTGLELDEILQKRPKLEVTGIDLSEDMLGRLSAKHPQVHTIRADYFR